LTTVAYFTTVGYLFIITHRKINSFWISWQAEPSPWAWPSVRHAAGAQGRCRRAV